jgi:hypothetical protein
VNQFVAGFTTTVDVFENVLIDFLMILIDVWIVLGYITTWTFIGLFLVNFVNDNADYGMKVFLILFIIYDMFVFC